MWVVMALLSSWESVFFSWGSIPFPAKRSFSFSDPLPSLPNPALLFIFLIYFLFTKKLNSTLSFFFLHIIIFTGKYVLLIILGGKKIICADSFEDSRWRWC